MRLPGPLVGAAWLAAHLEQVCVVDIRWSIPTGPKRDAYLAGHIPGAVFVDLDRDASAPAGPNGRHPLPDPAAFAAMRARLGIVAPVVVYDDKGGSVAARLWWMLDALDVDAAVLDGGIGAWTGELEQGEVHRSPAEVRVQPWPTDRFIHRSGLLAAIASGAINLDARSAERFRGEPNPIDRRFGHVPGARSLPWEQNLGADGRFLPNDQLRAQLEQRGIDGSTPLIASCGSGVTGCQLLLAARLAGLGSGRLYPGSWSEWAADPSNPIERGDVIR